MSDKKTLKDLLKDIKLKSDEVLTKTGDLQKTGNFVKELVEVSINLFDQSPMADNPQLYIADFQGIRDDLMKVNLHMDTLGSLASGVTYGTATAMTTLSGMMTPNNFRANPSYVQFFTQFDNLIDRGRTKDQAIAGIEKLKLNSIVEGKEAISLLKSAWEVHLRGYGISTSSLIPLREAIAKTLIAIQKKSPQSKIKNWIIDLGVKIALSYVSASDLQNLQNEHDTLRDKLSGSKNGNYSREEESILLREGTLHLLKIINIVDASKLR